MPGPYASAPLPHLAGHLEPGEEVVAAAVEPVLDPLHGRELEDGEVVTRTGRFFVKSGNAVEDAWDATKKGARKAGDAIEKGANKVGDEVKDVFDNDKEKKN